MKILNPEHPKSKRRKLNREMIVECALKLVREDGLEALTMRQVAAKLNAGAMSLYRHVSDRNDLLTSMIDHVAQTVQQPPHQPDDQEDIVSVMMAIHQEFRRDPWIVHILLFEGLGSLKILPLIERIFAALKNLGCDSKHAVEIYSLLMHYAYGECISYQTRNQRLMGRTYWDEGSYSDFPATKAVADATTSWNYDEFERNVRRILSHLNTNN